MTLQLQGVTADPSVQQVLDKIAQLFPVGRPNLDNTVATLPSNATARTFNFGTTSLTFTASTNSATATVTHGLVTNGVPVAPVVVFATAFNSPVFGNIPLPNVPSVGTTTFTLNGEVKTAFTGTVTIMWLAIG